jgi:glycyl-tRNA synthetase
MLRICLRGGKLLLLSNNRFFISKSFEIYGGVSGLYDFGPLGAALKNNVEQLWRNHFILEEDMLEISCTNLTPEVVLQASGHVDKFEDFMVRDIKNGQCYRADKLLEEQVDKIIAKKGKKMKEEDIKALELIKSKADSFTQEELHQHMKDLKVKAPDTGNEISEPLPFNLMFSTQIGPQSSSKGYFRPETAQSIFVNFKRLLEFNNGRLPFAAAQIGLGFRNEISPRMGLLRVREFTMAEIEHFYDPKIKKHPKFDQVKDEKLPLYSKERQETLSEPITDMTLAEAVEKGVISNEILAYFMDRTYKFFQIVGIPKEAIRFRQHLSNEMAHYACDCWD